VFVLIESMSNHYFDFHSKDLNLLGTLEQELEHCYTFRNFLSATSGTIHTLESLMVQTTISPIAQSPYVNTKLNSSVAIPFKENNYQVNYLTGDQLGWRNSGKFVKAQGFDTVNGFSKLHEEFDNPSSFSWGVHDEYLYQFMYKKLEKSTTPQFFFTLTISNHTPFDLPSHFKANNSLIIDQDLQNQLLPSEEIMKKNFTSYYYAADELGKFIHKIRTSPLGENTIIVATGDHNERGVIKYGTSNKKMEFGVPLIMYIPKKYKPHFANINRFGSHKDVFPTIYNLALSNQKYIYTGNDLFSNKESFYSIFSKSAGMNINGFVQKGKVNTYYKWSDSTQNELKLTTLKESPKLKELEQKINAHSAISTLLIQKDITEKKNANQK
jgi:phosphoglycerol transferase MdoB-like AlkP superfamily enzyme